ncbi:MAG: hypothetical protein E7383_00700 [Ruminococcaceae bacterium]|nr:hypothetical protein [Oscillospiraceae bacterium]
MFPDLALKVKNHAANMGSGFVVIAGFLLAITMVFVIVFARWNAVRNSSSFSIYTDKPRVESSVEDSGHVALVLPDKSGN